SSGFPAERLVTIHGTDAQVECLGCGFRGDRAPAEASWRESGEVPSCPTCGDWLKPAVVAFGQSLVMADLQRAFEAAARCDLFLAVGTSLVVSPINQMMLYAADGGAECAILTASETPYDELATWRCAGRLETVLPALRDRVLGGAASSTSS
ncbi:MAG: Sir2 family NAD-dependent protein deacetylase, partial [Acidobacteriota bacterium]